MTRATIIVSIADSLVTDNIAAYPVYIDMSLFPIEFWSIVKSDGGDLRARAITGTVKYPIDLVAIDTTAQTGHMFIRVPILNTGFQFRIDFGDEELDFPDPDEPGIGSNLVWQGFGPVVCGFSADFNRRPWNLTKYPTVELNGDFIHTTGGFLRAGRGADPDVNERSFSFIGKRTGGSDNAAAVSSNGYQTGNDDRETLYFRANGEIGVWNNVDGWLSAGAWSPNVMTQIGWAHNGTANRRLFQDGAQIASESGVALIPSDGNYKYFCAESNDINAPLTAKFYFAYMKREALTEDWYAFEYANWFTPNTALTYQLIDFQEVLDMTVLFAGTSIADFRWVGTPSVNTTSSDRDTYCAEAVHTYQGVANYVVAELSDAVSEVYFSYYVKYHFDTNNHTHVMVGLLDAADNDLAGLWGDRQFAINVGSGLVDQGSPISFAMDTLLRFDWYYLQDNTAGRLQVWVNGVSVYNYTGDTIGGSLGQVAKIKFQSMGINGDNWGRYSGVIVADTDTRAMRLVQRLPTGNGANNAWTGDYTSIAETGINDADFITSASVGDKETFTYADMPSEFANSPIAAVVISGRMQGSLTSPTALRGLMRVGSTDYEEDTANAMTTSYGPTQIIFPLNPASLAEWTASDINAAEFGFKSIS